MPAKKTATSKSTASKRSSKSKSKAAPAKTSSAAKKATSPKARTASSKGQVEPKAGDREVTIDRRRQADRRDEKSEVAVTPKTQPQLEIRAKVQRRRQIDPTTCERDYSDAEVEFMNAMDEYKRTSGRMFPTCSEVLEVIRELGYVQLTLAEKATAGLQLAAETTATEAGLAEDADLEIAEIAL